MTKSKINATVIKNTGYDALQPVCDFNTIAGNDCKKRSIEDSAVSLQKMLIDEEWEELDEAIYAQDVENVLKETADLIVVATGLIHKLGYSPNEVMKIVNESNMSKFCDTLIEAEESVKHYEKSSRYSNVRWESVGDKYVIFGHVAGTNKDKILKSINYKEPDFSQIMEG